MDYSFLQQLHEAIQSSAAHGGRHKHIIRFNRPGQYRECLSHLQKMKSGFSGLRRIQAAHSIRALIAPAACRERLERFQDRLVIERDSSVRIHKSSTPQIRIEPEGDIPWGIKQIRAPAFGQSQQAPVSGSALLILVWIFSTRIFSTHSHEGLIC